MESLKSYTIVWLEDQHECETCGYSLAYGYKIYRDNALLVNKEPVAHCFNSLNYDHSNAPFDILDLENIQVKTFDGVIN